MEADFGPQVCTIARANKQSLTRGRSYGCWVYHMMEASLLNYGGAAKAESNAG